MKYIYPRSYAEASKLYREHKFFSIFGIKFIPILSTRVTFNVRIPKYIQTIAVKSTDLALTADVFNYKKGQDSKKFDNMYAYVYTNDVGDRFLNVIIEFHNTDLYSIISKVFFYRKEINKSFGVFRPINRINWRLYRDNEQHRIKFT